MIPEIDIWRVANLMLTRYDEEAMLESAQHAHELAADGDRAGAATWLRVTIISHGYPVDHSLRLIFAASPVGRGSTRQEPLSARPCCEGVIHF